MKRYDCVDGSMVLSNTGKWVEYRELKYISKFNDHRIAIMNDDLLKSSMYERKLNRLLDWCIVIFGIEVVLGICSMVIPAFR